MFKQSIAALLSALAFHAFAGTEINKADSAELQTVRGIGASTAEKIVTERKKSEFKNWADLVDRVPGVGPKSAAKLSANGLTVNGASYEGAPASHAAPEKAKKPDARPAH